MNISSFIMHKNETILTALQRLNEIHPKNLYVVDDDERLTGSVSDGDIRRGLIEKMNFTDTVDKIMYRNPCVIYSGDLNKQILEEEYRKKGYKSVPVVDSNYEIVEIIPLAEEPDETALKKIEEKRNYVFIVAGGKGRRLEPLTNILPKPLIPIGKKPVLEIIMDRFVSWGFCRFIISVNYKAELIKLYLNAEELKGKFSEVAYIEEKMPLGTIGSLYHAKDLIIDDFIISNADIILKADFDSVFRFHKESNATLTIVGCKKKLEIPYGVLEIDNNSDLIEMQEKPIIRNIINTGVYIAKPEVIGYIPENTPTDITKLIETLKENNEKISVFVIEEHQWFDMGQMDVLKQTIETY